jgi:hypothetical protein
MKRSHQKTTCGDDFVVAIEAFTVVFKRKERTYPIVNVWMLKKKCVCVNYSEERSFCSVCYEGKSVDVDG